MIVRNLLLLGEQGRKGTMTNLNWVINQLKLILMLLVPAEGREELLFLEQVDRVGVEKLLVVEE